MAIPALNAVAVWITAGRPSDASPQILIDTYNVQYCDGTTKKNVDVNLNISIIERVTSVIGGFTHYDYFYRVQAAAVSAPTANITLNVNYASRAEANPDPSGAWVTDTGQNFVLTIIAGATTSGISPEFNLENGVDDDGFITTQETLWGVAPKVLSCGTPPPACTLEIDSVTVVAESQTGALDGSITVNTIGATGATQYSIDNGTLQLTNFFGGLGAGTYSVQAIEDLCFDELTGIIVGTSEFRSNPFTITQPAAIVASENPIVTNLRTAYNGNAIFASTDFVISSNIVNDSSIQFNLTNPIAYEATFISKDFPNKSNYFVSPTLKNRAGITVGTNSTQEIAVSLAEAIENDVNLSRWYFVDVNNNTVTLTAKEATDRMTLDTTNVTIIGTGILMNTIAVGNAEWEGAVISDYSLYSDVYVGDTLIEYGEDLSIQNYDNWTNLELPFNITNNHRFDISEVMKTFVSTPKIDLTFTGFTVLPDAMRPFYILYGEKYPLVSNENTKKKRQKGQTGFKWCINGALDFEQANDVTSYVNLPVPFLTNSPNPLQVQIGGVQFLYFILPKDYGQQLDVRGDVEYYDGTIVSGLTFFDVSTGGNNVGGVYALRIKEDAAIQIAQNAFTGSTNNKIKRITFAVWENNGTSLYSEEKTFRFEVDPQPRKFGVAFQNKKGMFDTFSFVGVIEDSIKRDNKTYTIPRDIQNDGSSPVGFKSSAMFDTSVIKTITVNSGWIDSAHFDWLIEMMNSNNIYSYTEDNQNYLNVIGHQYKKSSLDDLFELEITFELTLQENNITI